MKILSLYEERYARLFFDQNNQKKPWMFRLLFKVYEAVITKKKIKQNIYFFLNWRLFVKMIPPHAIWFTKW